MNTVKNFITLDNASDSIFIKMKEAQGGGSATKTQSVSNPSSTSSSKVNRNDRQSLIKEIQRKLNGRIASGVQFNDPNNSNKGLTLETLQKLLRFIEVCESKGLVVHLNAAYRTYEYQKNGYENEQKKKLPVSQQKWTKPELSRHVQGKAFDVSISRGTYKGAIDDNLRISIAHEVGLYNGREFKDERLKNNSTLERWHFQTDYGNNGNGKLFAKNQGAVTGAEDELEIPSDLMQALEYFA